MGLEATHAQQQPLHCAQAHPTAADNERTPPGCPACGGTLLARSPERGEIACASCGLAIEERIMDTGPERLALTREEQSRLRAGPSPTCTLHDKGLATAISLRDKDAHGKPLSLKRRIAAYRLRKWQARTRTSSPRVKNLAQALFYLKGLASQLVLPRSTIEEAAMIYTQLVRKRLIKGRSMEALVASSVYAACRAQKVLRTLDEIAKLSGMDNIRIMRGYRLILKEVGVKVAPIDTTALAARMCQVLGLGSRVQQRALATVGEIRKRNCAGGRSPKVIAASAVFLATLLEGECRTMREVADAALVTEPAIRLSCKTLARRLGMDYAGIRKASAAKRSAPTGKRQKADA